jgi:phosphate transport system permease protein
VSDTSLSSEMAASASRRERLKRQERAFELFALACLSAALVVLALLIFKVLFDGVERVNYGFLSSFPSRFAEKAGLYSALVGSFYLMALTGVIAVPLGVGAAVYLEEYAPQNRVTRLIELNLVNLAGVPSIIFGILGLQVFVRSMDMGRSLLAGALTMSLLILPVIVIAAREALRNVPRSLRDASLALGATKLQTIRSQVLPVAFPNILTGCILAFSRALGETAPLITMGALTYVAFIPDGLFSPFTVLPIQTFNWISRPQTAFHANAAGAIVVLLVVLLIFNGVAILLRNRIQQKQPD